MPGKSTTSEKVQGRFYFKLTESGNLLGEYSNQFMVRNDPECSSRTEGDILSFCGEFISTWQEDVGPVEAHLVISTRAANPSKCGNYSLKWSELSKGIKGKEVFVGEAMLSDGMLIGNYWATV
jgi:hypothetical protein